MKKPTVDFLKQLAKNNNRDWFAEHRKEYEAATADFADIVEELIAEIGRFDAAVRHVAAKDCIFRIFRDVRFSKEKTPYKPNFGAFVAPGGRKGGLAGYYLHVEPGGKSMVAGGAHLPPGPQLLKIRTAIAEDGRALRRILNQAAFKKTFGGISADALKTAPKGFPKDHPDLDLLRYKSFTVFQTLPDAKLTDARLIKGTLIPAFKTLKPFNDFLNRALA